MSDGNDQTQFMEDQVLWQKPTTPEVPLVPTEGAVSPPKKKPPVKLILAAVFGGIFLLMIIIVMISGMGRNSLQLVPQPSPSPSPTAQLTDFEKSMVQLHQDIVDADPAVNDLPFPPVNPSLFIIQQQ